MCNCGNKNTKVEIELLNFVVNGRTFQCPAQIERCVECGEEILNGKFALQNSMAMKEVSQ